MTRFNPQPPRSPEQTWVSDKTKIKVSIVLAASICCSIIGATWAARGYLEGWKGELTDHFNKVEYSQQRIAADLADAKDSLKYKWSLNQMVTWSNQLEKANRVVLRKDSDTGVIVPDPTTIPQRP